MGSHPSAPSVVYRDGPAALDAVIAADPDAELGPDCVARFGPRLPFLLKVLSADKALSIQVHPSRAQAQAGFAAENERGLAPGDPARNYVDDWPKPELLCALTPFEVLAGLRAPADAAAFLSALGVDQLKPLAAQLETSSRAIPAVLGAILDWPAASRPSWRTWSPRAPGSRRVAGLTETPARRPCAWRPIIPGTSAWSRPC